MRCTRICRLIISGDLTTIASSGHLPPIGSYAEIKRSFNQEDTKIFASLSGDDNPIHLYEESAKKLHFQAPIVHGMLCASLFSTVFGSQLPGSLYVSQSLQFKKPIYIDEEIIARVEVVGIRERVRVIECQTTCKKEDGTVAIDGIAQVLLPKV